MFESTFVRFLLICAVALAAHVATLAIRALSQRYLASHGRSESKARTIAGFATSVVVFAVYFGAVGFALAELGISLATYLASATVIGLAVSFGSQGVVQDLITGLTVVFSDLLDVGDMVEIGGQVGIVESVGMRFTVLVNFAGARVFVPNRSIANVINYPKGYIRAYVDVRLPAEAADESEVARRLELLSRSAFEQYPGILLVPPSLEGRVDTPAFRLLRVKFRLWPGQGSLLEGPVKQSLAQSMREIDAGYADWMVTVHYRSEMPGTEPGRRLPRPSATIPRPERHAGAPARPPVIGAD